jgi:hypothetical protein
MTKDPKFLEAASPQTKAKLLEKLQNFPFGGMAGERGKMALDLLKSCKTKDEYDQMVNALGGKKKVEDLFRDGDVKKGFNALDSQWDKKTSAAAEQGIAMLEQARTPEEAKQIADQLGGPSLQTQDHGQGPSRTASTRWPNATTSRLSATACRQRRWRT